MNTVKKMATSRTDGRANNEARLLEITPDFTMHAEGSVLVTCGNTKIICTASVEKKVPDWLLYKDKKARHGWVTAEYGMLPRSTGSRRKRETAKIDGRTQEIQRLIGRSMRSVVDLDALGTHTVWIDCDVIQADGGTRTASITGGFVALILALRKIYQAGEIKEFPVKENLAAISVGIAVDNTIHYIHRFKHEFTIDRNYLAAMHRSHESIGYAMYYTSITIIIGFSILVLSKFIPSIYFGLLTGLAMLIALVAALTLLPQLLIVLKPLGPENQKA